LLLTFIAACGKAPKTKPNQVITQENFSSMSHEEIMLVKYDNEIDLICDLRVHEGPYIDLNYKPSKSLTWQLGRELSQSRSLEFTFDQRIYSVEIKLGSRVELQNLEYTDSQGDRYSMMYSPTVSIRYRSRMEAETARDFYEAQEFNGEAKIYENLPTVIYSLTSENMETGETISEDLRCKLKTRIKEAYSNQWIRK